jgi:hypothetical protein
MEFIKGKSKAWKDITGKRFNYLTISGYIGNGYWLCTCDCGKEKILKTSRITSDHTKSCGCIAKLNALKHNGTGSREYNIWTNLKARCLNPNNTAYKNYGGRGITVCENWKNSFENFINDMGLCPDGYSIDRVENDKGYNKENCIWNTSSNQALNRRSNYNIEYKNKTKPLKQWCNELNMNYAKTFARINKLNWTIEKAFEYQK